MEAPVREPTKALLSWYATQQQSSRHVDIVGDFAGKELFVIHGESLIRYCLLESRVDFDYGFQLLHAVYAVENFLQNLSKRGCNFDIIFFKDLNTTCIPGIVKADNEYKYLLARTILIKHLERQVTGCQVFEFDSFENDTCQSYFAKNAVHFVFCNEGEGDGEGLRVIQLRHLIWKLVDHGTNVAIINSVTWKSSKVFAPLLCGTKDSLPTIDIVLPTEGEFLEPGADVVSKIEPSNVDITSMSLREWITIMACRTILTQWYSEGVELEKLKHHQLTAMVLHTAALALCSLRDRSCEQQEYSQNSFGDLHRAFLSHFSSTCHVLLRNMQTSHGSLDWNLYDLVDGRLFFSLIKRRQHKVDDEYPPVIVERARFLWEQVIKDFENVPYPFHVAPLSGISSGVPHSQEATHVGLLAFDHPVLNDYLKDVKVSEAEPRRNDATEMIFEDLHHWHSTKRVVDWKRPAPDFRERRRNQRQAAEIISYAASLTNSRGKVLDRETILVDHQKSRKQEPSTIKSLPQKSFVVKSKKGGKKGGKESALRAVEEVQNQKALAKRNDMIGYWAASCNEFENDSDLIARYLKATKFLLSRSKEDYRLLLPEVAIYACNILGRIFTETRDGVSKRSTQGLYLISMIWRWLQEVSASDCCTPDVNKAMQNLVARLRLPAVHIITKEPSRPLPFTFHSKVARLSTKVAPDQRIIQLEHGGPYMDRRFDSKPDSRVSFEPDAWQREVLDSIDANDSLLVVAPTSAGKTFISFYAMKKVLEESDDAVLVYVAPTKALVNQIAAEIEARFSKSYHGKEGKSVWAVHTRDYRINSPTGCQILVTVPQILQIMLLAPKNADRPSSWSRRVKRIIFDEVHCIGQSEDGVVWEQLLLLAPCPIIALSATIGNVDEFRDWLTLSQAQKGHDLKMVVHGVRYSDLRKFVYKSPKNFRFQGLEKLACLPVPGLDEGEKKCPNFNFVHPIVALKDRNRYTLEDVSLEARDCFTLWKTMVDVFPSELFGQENTLNPVDSLPEVISKADIVKWESQLKATLRAGMELPDSPFLELQARLSPLTTKKNGSNLGELPESHLSTLFALACDLHAQDALPAIVFSYDRHDCEDAVEDIMKQLVSAEEKYKTSDAKWLATMREYNHWLKSKEKLRDDKVSEKKKGVNTEHGLSKFEQMREEANREISPWESFDPSASLDQFSFADTTKLQKVEFQDMIKSLRSDKVQSWLITALQRGLGVHHAGMNRAYRQIVEVMFRKGYLRLVVATGTLALGINMPCKTVVFSGDSVFLTAQNYRQASGRAGRRGFDLLGNVVFNGIDKERVYEIMSSRLPDLRGQFPVSASLVLRLFGLLHGTENSKFASDIVQSLLSQTRVYLGGPDAKLSVKHHLRFSIEYLRRQDLSSAEGAPLNFAGLVGHLFFTENSVFAFHSLLKRGYFHQLCEDIEMRPDGILLEMMLVLCHLFNRIPVRRTERLSDAAHRSSSIVFLPRLPRNAEEVLIQHNQETLSIFKEYVQSYVNQHLVDKADRTLPFTKISVGQETNCSQGTLGRDQAMIRSPFVSLSGFNDNFESIHELCATVRDGVFLEESAIPYIPIWPHDTNIEFNAYIYDFFKHGSLKTLVNDNKIKRGDVWFFLRGFSLTLATIVASLATFVNGCEMAEDLGSDYGHDDSPDLELDVDGPLGDESFPSENARDTAKYEAMPIPAEPLAKKVVDSWEDDDPSELAQDSESDLSPKPSKFGYGGKGLMGVYKAFKLLQEEFDAKFKKVWA